MYVYWLYVICTSICSSDSRVMSLHVVMQTIAVLNKFACELGEAAPRRMRICADKLIVLRSSPKPHDYFISAVVTSRPLQFEIISASFICRVLCSFISNRSESSNCAIRENSYLDAGAHSEQASM